MGSMVVRIFIFALLLSFSVVAGTIEEEISGVINLQIEKNFVPSAVIGLFENGKESYISYGKTELGSNTKPNENTFYEIGSITKVFTGILLANLHNDGIVNLNDTISKYLTELENYSAGSITLLELSTHTSGLARMPSNIAPADLLNPYADYTEELLIEHLKSIDELVHPTPFSWNNYSNLGVGLLGFVLSKATKTPFEKLLHERVLLPLGLNDTTITLSENQLQRFATPYNDILDRVKPWDFDVLVSAGGIRSTVKDLMIFLKANMHPESTPIAADLKLAQSVHATNGKDSIGLGWSISTLNNYSLYSHGGGTGGYRSNIAFSKAENRGLITLTNSENDLQCVSRIFFLPDKCTPNLGYDLSNAILDNYVGIYTNSEINLSFVVTRKNSFLVYEIPAQEKGRLKALTENKFGIKNIATMEFLKNETTNLVDKMHFEQGAVRIYLTKQQ